MVPVVREFIRTRDPLIRDPLNIYTRIRLAIVGRAKGWLD